MDKLLIVMDQAHRHQKALAQGIELARATGAQLEIVAFTHEHPGRWPGTKGYTQRGQQTESRHGGDGHKR